jgi:hypothetical protein
VNKGHLPRGRNSVAFRNWGPLLARSSAGELSFIRIRAIPEVTEISGIPLAGSLIFIG